MHPGQAVPILAPIGQVMIVGSGGWGRVVCLLPEIGEPKAPLVAKSLRLPGSIAMLFTECCLEGKDGWGWGCR